MIPDYKCNAVYFSEWLKKDYPDIFIGVARILNKHNIAYDAIPNTKDIWCRDYMPLQLDKERYLCYEYKPDYLIKIASNRKYITDSLNVCRDMQLKIKETPLVFLLFIGCFVDSNGALGGRIICDTGYISSRSKVNVISFIVKTIYLATVMFKQIADSVSGVVFRFSDL